MNYIQLIKSYVRYLAYAIVHSFFSGLGQTFLLALFVPHIRDAFHYNNTTMGLVYSIATFSAAMTLPWAGRLIDRTNLKKYSFYTGLLLAVSILMLAATRHPFFLYLGFVGTRLSGQSLLSHISSTTMARYFGKIRGKALGLASLGHPLGEAILPIFVAQCLVAFGWRMSLVILAGFLIIIFFPSVHLLIKSDDPFANPSSKNTMEKVDAKEKQWTHREVLRTPFFWMVFPLALLPAFLATGFFFHQGSLAATKGWTMEWIATCFVGFAMFRIVASFSIGPVIDKYKAVRLYPAHLIPMALGLVLLSLGNHPLIGIGYLSLMGLSLGFEPNIKSAMWAEIYGTKHLGAIRSMILTPIILSTALSPILFGWFFDQKFPLYWLTGISAVVILISSLLASLAPLPSSK